MLVTVIIPTTGNPLLKQAIESVQNQEYNDIECFIVVDGKEREKATRDILSTIKINKPQTHLLTLPYATGHDGFNGHKIYGGVPYLVRGESIAFLDEDNWLDANHIASLVKLKKDHNLEWTYSMRKIVDQQGNFLLNDDCESLGIWKACKGDFHHVDTSCYLLSRGAAILFSYVWYRKFRDPRTHTPDAILCNKLVEFNNNFGGTGLYSVNYRLSNNPASVKADFFLEGNEIMKKRYPEGLPWKNGAKLASEVITPHK